MSRRWPAIVVLAQVAAGLAAQAPNPPQKPVFRADNRTVPIYATVRRDGRLVPDLPREAFEIRDSGKPTPVTFFSSEVQPLTVALLVDMSGSMLGGFLRVREGTLKFIEALAPDDRLRIGSFGVEIALSPHLTGDKRILERVAREELWPGGGTPMWSAANAGMQSLKDEPGRRVILILTDGFDTGELSGWRGSGGEVNRIAERENFMFYAIGVESLMPLQAELVSLTDETGGGHFTVSATQDLGAVFQRVAEELRHQYVLGFTPAVLDGREHRLEVRAGPGTTVRARRSYVAAR
jgi:Ca-activated chloride channel family protein